MNLFSLSTSRVRFICLGISILLLSGCATFDQLAQTRSAIKNSKFELTTVDPRIRIVAPTINSNGIVPAKIDIGFNLKIRVENRFGRDLPLNRIDIKLYADKDLVATGTTRKHVLLRHLKPTMMSAFVGVEPQAATRNLVKRLQGKKLQYRIDGVFYFKVDQFEIPITLVLKKI